MKNLVSNSWHELDLSFSSLCFKFSQLRMKVKNWQAAKYSLSVIRSKECETELSTMVTSPVPQNTNEL